MWWDESLSHYRATQSIPFILSNQILLKLGPDDVRTVDNHPPLYFVLLRMVVLAAGDSEFAMRFLSLVCSVLIVPLTYLCGRRLFGPGTGLLSALIASISPLYLWYQQEMRPYTMATALGLFSFYALMRVIDSASSPDRAPRRMWVVLYTLSVVAMLTTHYLTFLLLVAEGLILFFSWSRHGRSLGWVMLAVGVVAVGVFVWGMSALPKQAKLPSYDFLPFVTLADDVLQQFTLGLYADALRPLRWVAAGLFLAALALLNRRHPHVPWRHTSYVLLCAVLPVVEIYALSLVRPAYMNIRHLIFASPFYYLLLSAGAAQARRLWARIPMGLAWIAVVAGMALSTSLYLNTTIGGKTDHRAWGRYLSEHMRPGDLAIVNPGAISELYEYYVDSEATWVGLPILSPGGNTIVYLKETVPQYDRVWVAHSSTPSWANPDNLPLRWLRLYTTQIDFAGFESATTSLHVTAFRPKPPWLDALPDGIRPLALGFDDRLTLRGLSSPMDRVAAGHVYQLSLYWSPARHLDRDFRVTLSLIDEQGFSWAGVDYMPAHGTYPASEWPVNRVVRDDIDVDIPPGVPPGQYQLNASVYPADHSGPALAVRSLEDDRLLGLIVPVGEVEVVRPEKPPADRDLTVRYPLDHRYGAVSLLGHSYGGGAYQPGDVVLLDAYWRAIRRPDTDLTFEVQLVDETGHVQASRVVEPAGSYAPSQWHKGEVVRGQYRFRIPIDVPAGQYALALAPGGERAYRSVWPWDSGRVILNALTVRPADSDRTFEIPEMAHALGINLGDRVELLGIDLGSETVRAGETVSCTLYWRSLQVMSQNYTVFNHLVAEDGQTWGQWDNQPQRGMAPTTRWVPGQVVADPYQIPISPEAPAGPLELQVGMYDLMTMARLPVYDEGGQITGDHVPVAEIEVTLP